jgi:PAS domain S-box-containing protein
MTEYKSELNYIRELLNKNPRGLTISEISAHIEVNRNSVAKYLDVMLISGEIEQRAVGRAKLFYPSKRIPIANLLDYSSDLICVIDKNKVITQSNTNFCNFFNLKQKEILGKELSEVFDSKIFNIYSELLDIGLETPIEHIEINDYFFRPNVIPTVFIDGTSGTTIILGDITKEIQTIAALTDSENKFHTFVRAATSGLILFDSELMVIEINDAALKFTGLPREQVMGKHILDFNPDTMTSGRYASYQEILNKNIAHATNMVNLPPSLGGKRVITSVFSAGSGLGMIVTDISELRAQ